MGHTGDDSRLQDPVRQPWGGPLIDQRQDAERAVEQLIDGDGFVEALQAAGEVVGLDAAGRLIPLGLDPVLDRGVGRTSWFGPAP